MNRTGCCCRRVSPRFVSWMATKGMRPSSSVFRIRSQRALQQSSFFSTIATTVAGEKDTACELAASNLRFGKGATAEVGQDFAEHFKCRKVVVFTDPYIRTLPCMQVVLESLERSRVEYAIYDQVRVEPNDTSFQHAIRFLEQQVGTSDYDGVVAVGGGSVMDTAKAANLYACHPPPNNNFYAYVNPPIGLGLPIPGRVKPVICIPTTAGTGSETTGVAIFDDSDTQAKTGIANRHLKPALGIIDPDNTATLPATVATYTGLDVLCHAIESYTAMPFNERPKPVSPIYRPAYQGSNPISDVWSMFALSTCAEFLPRAIHDTTDTEARGKMLLASSAAGLGFGNAGVHLCHGMSYPISSQVPREYRMGRYPENAQDHALIPHGLSVILPAPAVFAWSGVAAPDRHETCAQILATARAQGGNASSPSASKSYRDSGAWLADEIRLLCDRLGVKLGLTQFGYTDEHIPALVEGTIPQHRVTKICPRPVTREALNELFQSAMQG